MSARSAVKRKTAPDIRARAASGDGAYRPDAAIDQHARPLIEAAIERYASDVRSRQFPARNHVYAMKDKI